MTSPYAPHPALRHADKEIETFVQYSYARLRTHDGAVLPTEKEVRKEYQQLCWEDMSETPLKAKYFSNQVSNQPPSLFLNSSLTFHRRCTLPMHGISGTNKQCPKNT